MVPEDPSKMVFNVYKLLYRDGYSWKFTFDENLLGIHKTIKSTQLRVAVLVLEHQPLASKFICRQLLDSPKLLDQFQAPLTSFWYKRKAETNVQQLP